MVALYGHVQRTEAVLRLGHDRGLAVQQQVDDLIVTTSGGTMQRRQTVLRQQNITSYRSRDMSRDMYSHAQHSA